MLPTTMNLNRRPGKTALASLVTASTASNIGTGAHFVAIAWFVLVTTGSAARTGAVSGIGMLGLACGSLAGGMIADRIGPKRTAVGADIAAALPVAMIPLLYLLHLLAFWHILLFAGLGGVFDMIGGTARQVMVPDIAGASRLKLDTVNSLMQLATNGAFLLLGPVAAGIAIPLIGPANVLFLDATTYVLSAAIMGTGIPNLWPRSGTAEPNPPSQRASPGADAADFRAGLRFIRGHDQLRTVLVLASTLSFLVAGLVTVLVPVIGQRRFGDPGALSLMVWGLGAGLAIGFVGLSTLRRRLSRDMTLRASFAAMAAMLWLLWLSHLLLLDVVALAIFGVGIGLVIPLAYSVVQLMVPPEILGRVIGVSTAVIFAAAPLGSLVAGAALAWQPLSAVLAMCALVMTAVGGWALIDPRLRGFDRLLDGTTRTPGRRSVDFSDPRSTYK